MEIRRVTIIIFGDGGGTMWLSLGELSLHQNLLWVLLMTNATCMIESLIVYDDELYWGMV